MAVLNAGAAAGPLEGYRNVAAIVAALTVMQAAVGALSLVGPLALAASGAPATAIGIAVAANALGFLLGARIAPEETARIGHIRSIAGFAALASLAAAGLNLSSALPWWMTMQFVIGLCVAGLLAAGESWVADAAPADRRGAILGFYLVASKLGVIAGPFLAASAPPGESTGFMIVAALFTACLLPVAATRSAQPAPPSADPFGPRKLWRVAPSSVIAAFLAGLVNGAVLQLYAVFAAGLGDGGARGAAIFNAAMLAGATLSQWPAGLLSDRMDRRVVIAGLALAGGVAAALLVVFAGRAPSPVIFALGALWGAGALSFYGVAVAHAADRAAPGQAASMMSGILMIWALGAMIGPVLAAAVIDSGVGPSGLFAFAALGLFALAGGMVYRRREAPPAEAAEKAAFAPSATTSVALAELSPMGVAAEPSDPLDPSATSEAGKETPP